MKSDIKILKYLYSKKNDGKFYDVSKIFNVFNPENYLNNVKLETTQSKKIASKNDKTDGKKRKRHLIDKTEIDMSVVALEENGYVTMRVAGGLPSSALTEDDDPSDANNSICMISSKGIEYFENYSHNLKTRRISVISIGIAILAIGISLFSFFSNI